MNITALKQVINYILDNNENLQAEGKEKITVEIIGDAGLGK